MTRPSPQLSEDLAAAHQRLSEPPGAAATARFPDAEAALSWVVTHQAALIVMVHEAADAGRLRDACDLVGHLLPFLLETKQSPVANDLAQRCLTAARTTNDRRAEGAALLHLGDLRLAVGDGDPVEPLRTAVEISAEVGDRECGASAGLSLGIALGRHGIHDEAAVILEAVASTYGELGDRSLEATARLHRARILSTAARHEEVTAPAQQAVEYFAEAGIRRHEAVALFLLGTAHQETGRSAEAIPALRQALQIFVEAEDRGNEAATLLALGLAVDGIGEGPAAVRLLQEAADTAVACEEFDGAAKVNFNLGKMLVAQQRNAEAIAPLRAKVEHSAAVGDDEGVSSASLLLGSAYTATGRFPDAIAAYRRALLTAPESDLRVRGTINAAMGVALVSAGRHAEAVGPLRAAASVYGDHGELERRDRMLILAETAEAAEAAEGKGRKATDRKRLTWRR